MTAEDSIATEVNEHTVRDGLFARVGMDWLTEIGKYFAGHNMCRELPARTGRCGTLQHKQAQVDSDLRVAFTFLTEP
ncbi:hypothetical protein AW736_22925 [Termitidicoccus mucosus]|uniref:Uncharacterized protein n=1 Tax=Termitidicoccus mucosus TaxID=1184151 RepID=A0A178IBM8_9BACT|nr:hypothetical protein AW736_22925 [Opitutaceae bacterium TSB47]